MTPPYGHTQVGLLSYAQDLPPCPLRTKTTKLLLHPLLFLKALCGPIQEMPQLSFPEPFENTSTEEQVFNLQICGGTIHGQMFLTFSGIGDSSGGSYRNS